MDSSTSGLQLRKSLAVAAVLVGVAAGSYGIASAASGSGSSQSAASGSSSSQLAASTATTPTTPGPPGATPANPWGRQRGDETPLTGDALAQVKAAALARLGADSTVVRIETDADGHAAYEAHMLKPYGTPAAVYVSESFQVVSVESR